MNQNRPPQAASVEMRALSSVLIVALLLQQRAEATYLSQAVQQQSYQLQAAAGSEQQQALLLSSQAPTIIPFSFNQNVQENQRAIVMCTTSSGETPVQFSWLKDGQPIGAQLAPARRIAVKSDADSSTLKISSVRLDHAGNYTCLAKNRFGTHLHSASLVVLGEPRWLKEPHPEPIVATRGQTIVIDCQTTGWPRPTQTWHIKTHTPNSEFEPLANIFGANGRVSLAPNGSLVIRNADKSDEANYLCKSSNGIGKGIERSTSLKVTVPAHFEPSTRQQTSIVRKSSQVQLRCDAYGDQPISIEWFKDNKPLELGHTSHGGLAMDARYSIHSNNNPLKNGLISQLLIKQAQRHDNAIFECHTRNPYGRDRLPMELVVQEEPDGIQNLQVAQVGARSVTLGWSEPYDGRSPITSYMFQYRRVASSPPLGDLALSELDYAGDAAGGDQQQAAKSALAGGSALADSDWQHASRIVLPVATAVGSAGNSSALASDRSITIEKLESSSRYVLRALAINAIGQSKFSQPMEFITDEEAPEVGPVNIRAEALNSTSIQVTWDEIPRAKHLGRIHGYYVGYRVANNNSAAANFIYKPYIINDFAAAAQQPGGAVSERLGTAIHDLKRDTLYEITVVAFNSRGSGPSSDFVVCKTIEMEVPKPVKLAIRRESNESIFIEWQRDPSDQNPVDDYVLYQEKNSASQEWLQVRLPGNQTQYKAPGLKCGTRYQFYITAHNKVGKSAPSEVVSASTSGALPVIPSKTSLIKWINSTCLLVNLNSFQDNGCRIKTFTVRYRVERQTAAAAAAAAALSNAADGNLLAANLVNANGMSPSHQALTSGATNQLGGSVLKSPLAASQPSVSPSTAYTGEWIAIRPKSNIKQQRANEEDRMEFLCDLSPVGEYTVHVAATNDVGRSEIEYSVLMSSDELRHSALKELLELISGLPNVFAYIPSIIVFLLAGLLLAIVSLILYTTAIKYYQKFIIMQNQMRATRRAKADEKRRRKLANSMNQSRHSQKLAELWADEYEEDEEVGEDDDDDDDDEDDGADQGGFGADSERIVRQTTAGVEGDDEDDGTATDELRSSSGSSASSACAKAALQRQQQQRQAGGKQQRVAGRRQLARGHSHLSHLNPHQHQHHQYSGSGGHHYLANISNSAFDTSSIDSPCNKQCGSGLSTASTDSMLNGGGRFQCLSSKQYVKMNEYTMLPSISASLSQPTGAMSDIYGTSLGGARAQHPSPAHQYRFQGTSPSGQSSSSASNHTQATTATTGSHMNANSSSNPSSLYYSTLRRTNMQTYLPQQRQQQQQQQQPQQQQQQLSDMYPYYMAPARQQQQQQQVAAATAAAVAAQHAANEAANSIFVPPQQIIYSAPNIRRQPPVFL